MKLVKIIIVVVILLAFIAYLVYLDIPQFTECELGGGYGPMECR